MAKNVFSQKEVGNFFNKNFISYKVQCNKNKEGEAIAKKYKVNAFPTLMWIKPDGSVVYKTMGMMNSKKLISEAKKALQKSKSKKTKEVRTATPELPGGG